MRYSLLLLAFAACSSSYKIIKQAEPNPLASQPKLAVAEMDFSDVKVGLWPEKNYLERYAGRPEVATYPTDKIEMEKNYRAALAKEVGALLGEGKQPYTLRTRVTRLVPGQELTTSNTSGGLAANTQGNYEVLLIAEDGTVLDQIEVEVGVSGDSTNPEAGQRLRQLGTKLAESVASYLKERAKPAK